MLPPNFSFAQPYFLVLLLLLPVWWWLSSRRRRASLRLTSVSAFARQPKSWKARLLFLLPLLRTLGMAALIIALARPQSSSLNETVESEGIDIVISLDISGSMLAEDFKPNRIEAAKELAADFIDDRPTDRIGLVIFAGESFTQCPVTIDHRVLKEQLNAVKPGLLIDGTAIGMGLATGVDRLRQTTGKSKVLILLTDGVNNTGLIDPQTALELAKTYGVRVYTVGIGTIGQALYPVQTPFGIEKQMAEVQIDEPLLKQIAAQTGGKYYRATGNESLRKVYAEIDQLEKVKIETSSFRQYKELFFPFALFALICIGLEMLLRYMVFRSVTEV